MKTGNKLAKPALENLVELGGGDRISVDGDSNMFVEINDEVTPATVDDVKRVLDTTPTEGDIDVLGLVEAVTAPKNQDFQSALKIVAACEPYVTLNIPITMEPLSWLGLQVIADSKGKTLAEFISEHLENDQITELANSIRAKAAR